MSSRYSLCHSVIPCSGDKHQRKPNPKWFVDKKVNATIHKERTNHCESKRAQPSVESVRDIGAKGCHSEDNGQQRLVEKSWKRKKKSQTNALDCKGHEGSR